MHDKSTIGQSDISVASNASYFLKHLREYRDSVANIDSYKMWHDFISKEVEGVETLLDVGNGGVFDYDTSRVGSITAVDLFLADLPPDIVTQYFPSNVQPKTGSALALPEPDNKFDMVLMVMLLHHLTGSDWRSSWQNARLALQEGWRVLRPGGRLLIFESCVPWWFYHFEKPALWVLSRTIKTVFSHPITLQFPAEMIADEMRKKTKAVQVTAVPKGKHVLQYGFKFPSFLTPAATFAISATKSA